MTWLSSVSSGASQSSQFVAEKKDDIETAVGVPADELEALLDGDVSRALGIGQKEWRLDC